MSGHPGIIHSHCVVYAGSHHANIDLQSFPATDAATQTIIIPHRAVSIIQHQTRNYYHWLLESFPKLLLLQRHLLSHPENADIRVLVPEPGTCRPCDQTLALPAFAALRDRIVPYKRAGTTRYAFPRGLWIVDWIHPREDAHGSLAGNLWGVYWPPREVHHLVRDFFHHSAGVMAHPAASEGEVGRRSVVYVARKGKTRAFPNEDALVVYLRNRFGARLVVHTGTEALEEQVRMFAQARVVVGNHGAGLTNYVFTRPGRAALVMVPMHPHVEFCFSHLVAALSGRSYVVTEIPGAHYYGSYGSITENQMKVLGDTVEEAFDEMLAAEKGSELKEGWAHDEL
ncbi:hypothetical protein BC830DRAFT_1210163 [Chytriomyces sp. MP71]|nr:hypothetical protein BC830DRAFT_1210163 [Chytriomyces sp. MP71]